MPERGEHEKKPLEPIEIASNSVSWIDGKVDEVKKELRDARAWKTNLHTKNGIIHRKEREIYHLETRLSDLNHLSKNFKSLVERLRTQSGLSGHDETGDDFGSVQS